MGISMHEKEREIWGMEMGFWLEKKKKQLALQPPGPCQALLCVANQVCGTFER